VREAIARVRDSATELANAHIELLKAELALAGQELAIIVGLALGALLLASLLLFLVYIGTFLFLGEWLFGSIAWGILHGALLTVLFIVPIGLNLAGGRVSDWGRGFAVAVAVTLIVSLVFASNVLRNAAVQAGEAVEPSLAIEPAVLPTLVGLVVGALGLGVALALVGLRVGGSVRLLVTGLVVGGIVGAILGSVTFDTQGAVAVGVTIGLVSWLAATGVFAARRGFDPERRYRRLVPRESMAAFEESKALVQQQLRRQRGRMMGR
jgi:hypothetical protein